MINRKLRVFLCHSSQDKPVVRELYHKLLAEGWIDPWLDEAKLLPGQDWDIEIEKAVEASDAVIVCLSDASVNKEGYIQKELRFALNVALEKPEETIFIIPLRLDNCFVPRSIRSIQYLDYFPNDNKVIAYNRMRDSLLFRAKTFGINTAAPARPIQRFPQSALASKFTGDGHRVYVFGGIEFVRVPEGKFLMGSDQKGAVSGSEKKPKYGLLEMNISYDYFMGRYTVTNSDYSNHIVDVYKHEFHPSDFLLDTKINPDKSAPVVMVAFKYGVLQYVRWLNNVFGTELPDGYEFRLPSESEWEKAARGTDGRFFPWGNDMDPSKCNTLEGGKGATTAVGFYSPKGDSPYGASDMAGNVWEYTRSLWVDHPLKDSGLKFREDENSSKYRVIRGGSYSRKLIFSLSCLRRSITPGIYSSATGFRVAIVPKHTVA